MSQPRSSEGPALLFTNIAQLLTLRGPAPRRGAQLSELGIVKDAAVLCAKGKILRSGPRAEARRDNWIQRLGAGAGEVDCRGGVMLPGFVDAHTHPAFMAPRLADFAERIAGASYQEITERGGGIGSSVAAVRQASREELAQKILSRLQIMAAHGTTTVEAKSGYGLSLAAEIKCLEAIREAARRWPGTVVRTLLGAHAVPAEYQHQREVYVRLVAEEMVPQAAQRKLAEFVDVYCEVGAFSALETSQVLDAARQHGLGLRAHVGQFGHTSLKELLCRQPASLDHLDHLEPAEIDALANSSTVAMLLPGANYFLGLKRYPPARDLIERGVAVALATDYNPGTSPTCSIPMVLSIACTQMKMTPEETIAAATVNAACSLGLGVRKGSIESGKDADLALFAVADYREIPYWFGANLCAGVCLNGEWRQRDAIQM